MDQNPTSSPAGHFLSFLILPHLHRKLYEICIILYCMRRYQGSDSQRELLQTRTRISTTGLHDLENHLCESWHLHGFYSLLGDGGNDVSMIQEADCGVGVEGKVRLSTSLPRSSIDALAEFFSPRVSCQDLSHVQRPSAQMIPLYGASIVSQEEAKDDRMPLSSSKSQCLSSACLSRWAI